MIVIKVFVQGIIIQVYATQLGLDDSQKDDFHDTIINSTKRQGRRKLQLKQETLMVTSKVTQKPLRTSMGVMVMDLGTKKGKGFLSFVQL